jgi:general secretion pathway protein G
MSGMEDHARTMEAKKPQTHSGFALIELLAVMVAIGILMGFGLPRIKKAILQAQIVKATGDIQAIQTDIMAAEVGGVVPPTLAAVGRGGMLDPWGRPYIYFPFDTTQHGNPPGARRDRFMVPINSTFDLYSVGPDGATALPLTAAPSKDDIIRANDGGFIGLASKF